MKSQAKVAMKLPFDLNCGVTLGPHSNMAAWDVDGFSLLINQP